MAVLSVLAFAPASALGQDATWLPAPATNAFNTGTNWSTGTVPTNIAIFGASTTTSIDVNGGQTLNAFAFTASAPAYSFSMVNDLTFTGAGIVNNSSNAPSITTQGRTLTFDTASAGNASIGNNFGFIFFQNGATAATASIINFGATTFSETSAAGSASIVNNIGGTLSFADNASAQNATITSNGSLVQFTGNASAGNATITTDGFFGGICFSDSVSADSARIIVNGGSSADMSGMTAPLTVGSIEGTGSFTLGGGQVTVGGLNLSTTVSGVIDDSGGNAALVKIGSGTLTLTGTNTYAGGTVINGGAISVAADANLGDAAGTLALGGGTLQTTASFSTARATTLNAGGGIFNTASGTTLTHGGSIGGTGVLIKSGTGTLTLTGNNLYSGGTTVTGGLINFAAGNNLGTGTITLNGGGLQWATGNTTDISSRLAPLGAGGATIDTNGNAVRFATGLTGSGGLTKNGGGALFLLANNTYTGGTTVNGGILHIGAEGGPPGSIVGTVTVNGDDSHIAFLSTSSAGNLAITLNGGTGHFFGNSTGANATITANAASTWFIENSGSGGQARFIVNAGGAFDISPLAISGTTAGSIEGAGAVRLGTKQLTVGANNLSTTVSGVIADGGRNGGTGGSLVKVGTGTLTLSGANTFTGGTTVNAGGLVVNGSLASTVTLNDGMLAGSGTIGGLVANGGMLAPGNSIGTLYISGNFAQTGGSYVVEANAQGQSDRVNVTGTATINGGTVQLVAAPGNYATSTTYTILNATGGVSGSYSGVSSNFAFLTPSLSYNANNVFLTLALQGNAFSGFVGNTVNQRAVGYALDQTFANASGDFATVIGALAGLSTHAGASGARRHQRPAVRRLRHDQRGQRLAVHEHARPADGAGAQRQHPWRARGLGASLRGRGVR